MKLLPLIHKLVVLVIIVVGGGVAARAQDVTITPFVWVETKDAPDELPSFKKSPKITFPEELRATTDFGYVILELNLDEKARALGGAHLATQPLLDRTVTEAKLDWRFNVGRREGKPVFTASTFAVIFNPASAAEKIPEATPRLLAVSVVDIPWPKGVKPDVEISDRVVWADICVDAQGEITGVKNAPPELAEKFTIAVKNWRFAPARKAGQPVAAEVKAPFVVHMKRPESLIKGTRVPARVISQERPVYPWAMRLNGMRGEVLVDFVVNREGRVQRAFVARTLNPSFDAAALDAVRNWRFEPARVGDRPVSLRMQVPIVFLLNDEGDGGSGPLKDADRKPDLSKLPEIYRYDVPAKPIGTARPVYPYELLKQGKTGDAAVGYVVGSSGKVIQTIPDKASTPEFARALTAAIEQFVYDPALKQTRPSPSLQRFRQQFDLSREWGLVDSDDLALLRREQKKPESIYNGTELDKPLKPISKKPPIFPVSAPAEMSSGKAVIEVLVDEEGCVRLPRIVEATDDAFGYAAIQSVASWRFESPKRGGRDVVVRVRIPFAFTKDAAKPAADQNDSPPRSQVAPD